MAEADASTTLLLQINSNLEGIRQAQKAFLDLQKGAQDMASGVAKAGKDAGSGFITNIQSELSAGIGLGTGFTLGSAIAKGFVSAFSSARAAIAETVNIGEKLNATLESSQFGIAGVLKQFDPGKFSNFSDAMRGSGLVLDLLLSKSKALGLSFPELAEQYRATAGAMFKGGITDLNQQIELSILLKRSMDAVGISGFQAVRDTADILNGISKRTMAGRMLHLDDADLKAASDAGTLYEYLKQKLEGFSVAADAAMGTLEALDRRFEATKANVAAEQTRDLNEAHKDLLKSMTALVQSDSFATLTKWWASMKGLAMETTAGFADLQTNNKVDQRTVSDRRADLSNFQSAANGVKSQSDLDAAKAIGTDTLARTSFAFSKANEDTKKILSDIFAAAAQTMDALKQQGTQRVANNVQAAKEAQLERERAKAIEAANAQREALAKKAPQLEAKAHTEQLRLLKEQNPAAYMAALESDKQTLINRDLNGNSADVNTYKTPGTTDAQASRAADTYRKEILGQIAAIQKEIDTTQDAQNKKAATAAKQKTDDAVRLASVKAQMGTDVEKIAALQMEENALDATAHEYAVKREEIEQRIAKIKDDAVARSRAEAAQGRQRAQEATANAVREDKYLTEREKKQLLYLQYKKEAAEIQPKIDAAQAVADSQPDGSATKAQAEGEVKGLKQRRDVDLPKQIDLSKPLSQTEEFAQRMTQIKNGFIDIAGAAGNVAESGIRGLADGIDGLLTKTKNWHQAVQGVFMSVASAGARVASEMAAQWIVGEGIKTAASLSGASARNAITTGETITKAGATAAQVGIHVGGEAAKTGASAVGSSARSGMSLAETIFHSLQVGVRVAAHFVGETLKTAITIAQTPLRIAAIIAESIASVAQAATGALSAMASIPYVGPFLAVGAMAAVLAAGTGIVKGISKGFSKGGYTGPGGTEEVAGPVHKGEVVFSQADIARHGGVAAVESMRVGGSSYGGRAMLSSKSAVASGTPAQGSGGDANHNFAYFNTRQDAETWLTSQKGRRVMVDFLKQQQYEI